MNKTTRIIVTRLLNRTYIGRYAYKYIHEHGFIPEDIKKEAEITEYLRSLEDMQAIGKHSNYTCPDCDGGLWKIKEEINPCYRCYTRHVLQ